MGHILCMGRAGRYIARATPTPMPISQRTVLWIQQPSGLGLGHTYLSKYLTASPLFCRLAAPPS